MATWTTKTAAIRHDLVRYRNLLGMNGDERIRAALRDMIAELEYRLQGLDDDRRKPVVPL